MIAKKYIVFDIGKTKILAATLKLSRKSYSFMGIIEYKNPRNPEKIQKIILDFCNSASAEFRTKKVAISAAHIVDPEKNVVRQGKNCYGKDIFDFNFLKKENFSIKIENDGGCFALGEYYYGKRLAAKNMLTINLGTEIGGGFIIDGMNYRGSNNSALEISHISSNYGNLWKDWASLCAGKGIENLFRQKVGVNISAKEIFLKAKKNDKIAKEMINRASLVLGNGIASLINILDPEIIVFGGSLSNEKNFISEAVKIARKKVFNNKANYKFTISSLGNKANLLGAAMNFQNSGKRT